MSDSSSDSNPKSSELKTSKPVKPNSDAKLGWTFLSLGWEMAAWLGLSAWAGQWLNTRWGPPPLGLLLCLGLGFVGCGWSLYRAIKRLG
jgi:hypothetical protein